MIFSILSILRSGAVHHVQLKKSQKEGVCNAYSESIILKFVPL